MAPKVNILDEVQVSKVRFIVDVELKARGPLPQQVYATESTNEFLIEKEYMERELPLNDAEVPLPLNPDGKVNHPAFARAIIASTNARQNIYIKQRFAGMGRCHLLDVQDDGYNTAVGKFNEHVELGSTLMTIADTGSKFLPKVDPVTVEGRRVILEAVRDVNEYLGNAEPRTQKVLAEWFEVSWVIAARLAGVERNVRMHSPKMLERFCNALVKVNNAEPDPRGDARAKVTSLLKMMVFMAGTPMLSNHPTYRTDVDVMKALNQLIAPQHTRTLLEYMRVVLQNAIGAPMEVCDAMIKVHADCIVWMFPSYVDVPTPDEQLGFNELYEKHVGTVLTREGLASGGMLEQINLRIAIDERLTKRPNPVITRVLTSFNNNPMLSQSHLFLTFLIMLMPDVPVVSWAAVDEWQNFEFGGTPTVASTTSNGAASEANPDGSTGRDEFGIIGGVNNGMGTPAGDDGSPIEWRDPSEWHKPLVAEKVVEQGRKRVQRERREDQLPREQTSRDNSPRDNSPPAGVTSSTTNYRSPREQREQSPREQRVQPPRVQQEEEELYQPPRERRQPPREQPPQEEEEAYQQPPQEEEEVELYQQELYQQELYEELVLPDDDLPPSGFGDEWDL